VSYILDALKKSEKERSLGNVPTLGSNDQQQERHVPLRWFLLTVVCLVVALLVTAGWVFWSSGAVVGPVGSSTVAPASGPAAAPEIDQPVDAVFAPESATGPAAQDPAAPVPIGEVESSIRSRIPEIRINVLSYSENSSKRFVMIGQDIFKEGEEVSRGVTVEEIRNSDVIFRFEDLRFVLEP